MKLENNILICPWTAAAATVAGSSAATAGTITATQFFTTAAAGGTAAAGAAGAASAITALDIISGVATAFGVLSSINEGQQEADLLELQAREKDENAQIAALNAKIDENDAREKMIKALSQNIAAAGASNLDLSSGTIQTGLGEIARKGNQEIDIKRATGDIEIKQKVRQATQLRIQAAASKRRGFQDAAFGLLDFGRKQLQRGKAPVNSSGVA